jgi:hypothetical protein
MLVWQGAKQVRELDCAAVCIVLLATTLVRWDPLFVRLELAILDDVTEVALGGQHLGG